MDEEKGRVGKWGERKGREGRTKGGRREGRTKGGRREEGEGKGGGGGERKRVEGREGTEKERREMLINKPTLFFLKPL